MYFLNLLSILKSGEFKLSLFKPNVEKLKKKRDVKGLIKALEYKNVDVRIKAVEALGEIKDERAVEPLIMQLASHLDGLDGKAAEALFKYKDRAIEPLIQFLNVDYQDIRKAKVALILGRIKSKKAVGPLIQALKDDDPIVRKKTAEALGRIGSERAVKPLIQALKNDEAGVRKNAAKALGEIKNDKAIKPLIKQLILCSDGVDESAAEALVKYGGRAVDHLIKALKDKDSHIRGWVVIILDKIGWHPKDDIEKAWYLAAREEWDELIKLKDESIEPLLQVLKNDNPSIRMKAAEALDKIGWHPKDDVDRSWYFMVKEEWSKLVEIKEPSIEPLLQALKDNQSSVRMKAAETLDRIKDPSAIDPMLRYIFKDVNEVPVVRKALLSLVPVFSDGEQIINFALEASSYQKKYRYKYDAGMISHEEADDAIEWLCNLVSPITTNILHLIMEKRDINVSMDTGCGQTWIERVSYKNQREMAKKELKRRGNPPYDPSAYLEKDAWKL